MHTKLFRLTTESDNKSDECRFKFGADPQSRGPGWIHCFAKTASSVLRSMMLRAVNNQDYSPKLNNHSDNRNKRKLCYNGHGNEFRLASSKITAMEYYSSYDKLHPHFRIEHQFKFSQSTRTWHLHMPSTMMLVFRRNFTEVIKIGTSLTAEQMLYEPSPIPGHRQYMPPGCVESTAHVHCIVRKVSNPEHDVLKLLRALKATNGYQHECIELAALLQKLVPQLPAIHDQVDDDDDLDESQGFNGIVSPPSVPRPQRPLAAATPKARPLPIPGPMQKLRDEISPIPAKEVQELENKFAGLGVAN